MCRNIKTLFNFEPPASELEIHDASLQFVRKLSGCNVPSKANEAAFEMAVNEVAASARWLMQSLVTRAAPRNREAQAALARARSAVREVTVRPGRLTAGPLGQSMQAAVRWCDGRAAPSGRRSPS
jgi:hypothetical protein